MRKSEAVRQTQCPDIVWQKVALEPGGELMTGAPSVSRVDYFSMEVALNSSSLSA